MSGMDGTVFVQKSDQFALKTIDTVSVPCYSVMAGGAMSNPPGRAKSGKEGENG